MHYTDLHEEAAVNEDFFSNLEASIPVFKKQFNDRSKKENKLIVSLLEQIPYFSKYCYIYDHYADEDKYLSQAMKESKKREALKNLSSYFKHEQYHAGVAICHQGDPSDKFFFILKGEVRRFGLRSYDDIQSEIKSNLSTPPRKTGLREKRTGSRLEVASETFVNDSRSTVYPSSLGSIKPSPEPRVSVNTNTSIAELVAEESDEETEVQNPSKKIHARATHEEIVVFRNFRMDKKYFLSDVLAVKCTKKFIGGDYIGEMSLSFSVGHSDTLVAWKDTDLISIDKKHFQKVFDVLIHQNREKLDFVAGLLPDLPQNEITTLAYGFEQIYYRTPTCIFQNGQAVDGLYIVKEGEVELFTTVNLENDKKDKALALLKKETKVHKVSVLITSQGQLLGEEALLRADKRIFTAVTKSSNTILYFIPKKHLSKMQLYNLNVIEYLTNLAKSLYIAKEKLLEKALEQNRFQRKFVNHAIEKVIGDEKEQLGEVISEIATKVLEDQKEALMPSGSVRLRQIKSPSELNKDDRDTVEKIVDIKKRVSFLKAKIDPNLSKEERAKARARIRKETSTEAIVKFIRNVPSGAIYRGRSKLVYPFCLWENARDKYLPEKTKEILKNHIAQISKHETTENCYDFDLDSLMANKDKNVFSMHNLDTEISPPGSITLDDELSVPVERVSRTEGDLDNINNKTEFHQYLIPHLHNVLNTKLSSRLDPICIQGLTGRAENGTISISRGNRMSSIEEIKKGLAEKISSKRTRENEIFRNKNRYSCNNLDATSETKSFLLPQLRPKKALTSRIPLKEIKSKATPRISSLKIQKAI